MTILEGLREPPVTRHPTVFKNCCVMGDGCRVEKWSAGTTRHPKRSVFENAKVACFLVLRASSRMTLDGWEKWSAWPTDSAHPSIFGFFRANCGVGWPPDKNSQKQAFSSGEIVGRQVSPDCREFKFEMTGENLAYNYKSRVG